MNMRKLMAVVLAVVLAISAMAVNVFAGEAEIVKIPLRPNQAKDKSKTYDYTFEFPIYNLYGYANQDSYLELTLPNYFNFGTEDVTWYISTNLGNKVRITNDAASWAGNNTWRSVTALNYQKVYVNFGYIDRDYVSYQGDQWATIRQGVFGDVNTLILTATVTVLDWDNQWWDGLWGTGDFNGTGNQGAAMSVQLWTAGDDGTKEYGTDTDQKVTGSIMYAMYMTRSRSDASVKSDLKVFRFMSDMEGFNVSTADLLNQVVVDETTGEATNVWTVDGNGYYVKDVDTYKDANNWDKDKAYVVDLTWDMTLQNRAYVMNAESARVVVKFAGWVDINKWSMGPTTKGTANYSLYMQDTPIESVNDSLGQLWYTTSAYNRKAERVSAFNVNNEEVSELSFNVPMDKLYNATYGISAGITSTFRIYNEYEVSKTLFADPNSIHYNHAASEVYLELTMPAEEAAEELPVENPVESDPGEIEVDPAEEEPVVEEPAPAPVVEKNPTTGVALAVLPMLIAAAAAAVASKRR